MHKRQGAATNSMRRPHPPPACPHYSQSARWPRPQSCLPQQSDAESRTARYVVFASGARYQDRARQRVAAAPTAGRSMTGPPKEPPGRENRPAGNGAASITTAATADSTSPARQLRHRREASRRLPVLQCGRSDPWHAERPHPAGYEAAAPHLLGHGLLPAPNREGLRAMWRRGGHARQAAQYITEGWGLCA